MEAGEMEMRKVFEETTKKNVQAAVDHANDTRTIVRILEEKVHHLENRVNDYDKKINELRLLLVQVQSKIYEATR